MFYNIIVGTNIKRLGSRIKKGCTTKTFLKENGSRCTHVYMYNTYFVYIFSSSENIKTHKIMYKNTNTEQKR